VVAIRLIGLQDGLSESFAREAIPALHHYHGEMDILLSQRGYPTGDYSYADIAFLMAQLCAIAVDRTQYRGMQLAIFGCLPINTASKMPDLPGLQSTSPVSISLRANLICVFRSMPATSSGACRAMIPVHVGPPFRSMPAGGCDAG
jgi:hypothetical protein